MSTVKRFLRNFGIDVRDFFAHIFREVFVWSEPQYPTPVPEGKVHGMSTRAEQIENLAAGFIEATTEWDFAQLPAEVQESLRAAASAFMDWLHPDMVTETIAVGHHTTSLGSLNREGEAIARLRLGQDCGYYCVCGFAVGISADGSIVHAGTGEPCEVA